MLHRLLLQLWPLLPDSIRARVAWLLNDKRGVDVSAIILRHGTHVLLAEHSYKPECPWQLPGGHLKHREHLAEGLRRELSEELGLAMERGYLVHAEAFPWQMTLFYVVEVSGTFRPSAEVTALKPFPLDALPETLPVDQRRALLLATTPA